MEKKEPKIKIYVAHHKESKVIKNEFIIPIQVGAEIGKNDLKMLKDNTGDNISGKNELYCELTAQYWAWKNDNDADYLGFMHYRRYFIFSQESFLNEKGIIKEYDEINNDYIKECGLEKEKIKNIVSGVDIILPSIEKVLPEGLNIFEHYCIYPEQHKEDYELMLQVIKEKFPEYYKTALEYSKSHTGYFCNMFIMKKEYFIKYSEWLFTILEEMEKRKDFSLYSVSEYRVLAYLAERLLGIFVTHIIKDKSVRILELQHTFVKNVDIQNPIFPAFHNNNHLIFMSSDDYYVPYMGVLVASIIENSSKENNYDLVILTQNISDKNKKVLVGLAEGKKNISIRFVNVRAYLKDKVFNTEAYALETYYRLFAPEIFINYNNGLYLDSDMVVESDIAEIFEVDIQKYLLAGIRDYDEMGHVRKKNDDWSDYLREYVGIEDLYSPFQGGVLYMNLEKFRKECPSAKMVKLATAKKYRIADQDVLNLCCEGKVKYISPAWDIMVDNQNKNKEIFCFSPKEYYKEYKQALEEPKIIHFCGWPKPWNDIYSDMAEYFWKYARNTPFYEIINERILTERLSVVHNNASVEVYQENKLIEQIDNQGVRIKGVEDPIYMDGVMIKAINTFNKHYPIGSKKRNRLRKFVKKFLH